MIYQRFDVCSEAIVFVADLRHALDFVGNPRNVLVFIMGIDI